MNINTKLALLSMAAIGSSSLAQAESLEERIAKLETEIASLSGSQNLTTDDTLPDFSLRSWADKTSLGGYGELHWNLPEGESAEVDFHRFVLFINHNFTDRIRFISEVELEHTVAGDGQNGEVELEQAFIEMDLTDSLQARAGLFLIPVGIINETHEPPTFYGVERNRVENRIIPTTWWEAGAAFTKKYDSGLIIDSALTSGLQIDATRGSIRAGRNKVSEANAENVAITTRASYVGIPGLKVSAFGQYNTDILAGSSSSTESAVFSGATVEYTNGGFGLRALYSRWDIDGVAADAENQYGYYIEPSYKFDVGTTQAIGVFARYEDIDYYDNAKKTYEAVTIGVNYWPHDNVVFKADYQFISDDNDQANLGIGYQF